MPKDIQEILDDIKDFFRQEMTVSDVVLASELLVGHVTDLAIKALPKDGTERT